ncbi:KRT84 protein, partial [Crypturellus undulatus]|nr:KRT84 protein [Crypturellus undulatus]
IHSGRSFGSGSAAIPRNGKGCAGSAASCWGGSGAGYRGLGYVSSRSISSNVTSRPRMAMGSCHPLQFGIPSMAMGYGGAGFGYRFGGAQMPIAQVVVNQHLLQPLQLEVDPNLQSVKYQEKEQIKTLNNKFAAFIDGERSFMVRILEQQNKVLETKWRFLQDQKCCRSNIKPMLETYLSNLKNQLDVLGSDKAKLEAELSNMQDILEDYKKK